MNKEILTKLADTLISVPTPILFYCDIKFKDNGNTENVSMCYCTEEEYEKVSNSEFDNDIFFYLISADGVLKDALNNDEWEITDINEDSAFTIAID